MIGERSHKTFPVLQEADFNILFTFKPSSGLIPGVFTAVDSHNGYVRFQPVRWEKKYRENSDHSLPCVFTPGHLRWRG